MAKRINPGSTQFDELALILEIEKEVLEEKTARLFPLGQTKDENQTTSIFLASLSAVKEYREYLLSEIGVNKISNRNVNLHVFTEIYDNSQEARPDGLLVLTSGKNNPVIEWACFIESKVGNKPIDVTQIERYIDFAKEIGVKSIISISNEITAEPSTIPYETKKARSFDLFHWSWAYLKVMSTRLLRTDSVEDEDHVYILSELRRYFDAHPNVNNFTNMGNEWKNAAQIIHEARSDKLPKDAVDVVVRAYAQEEKDISLQLTDWTPHYIHLFLKKDEDRHTTLRDELHANQTLTSTYTLNGEKKRKFEVEIDFIQKAVTCKCQTTISKGKAQAQTTALLSLLDPAGISDDIKVEAVYQRNKREGVFLADLYHCREHHKPYPILNKEYGDEIKYFEILRRKELGRNFTGTRTFIDNLEEFTEAFLNQVVSYVI